MELPVTIREFERLAVDALSPEVYGFVVEEPTAVPSLAAHGVTGRLTLPEMTALLDPSLTGADLGWLAGLSGLPVLVKGVLTAEDAALAVAHGAAGVIVSNHGGRQLDGGAALDMSWLRPAGRL